MLPVSLRPRRRSALALGLAVGIAVLALGLDVRSADAVILPAVTLDGPSESIVGFGGVAMAEDGTGGAVYLKRVDGITHVFVARYANGQWLAPVRVDTEQPFAASWPRIGAADDGELVVVWVTPFATRHERPVDELLAATLAPGATGFGPATVVDPDVEEGTGTSPDLAMSSTGRADVVYRVVKPKGTVAILHPGDVDEEVRVAHYDGARWTRLGAVNRDPEVAMRPPSSTNAPQIAIGPTGNGVVVWQEPEIDGVARIWARRLFSSTLDFVLPVSASSYNGAAIGQDADAPSVSISFLGQAEVAYRQASGPGSPLPGPRIFINTLPDGEAESGAEFSGAVVADPEVSGATIGPPSIDADARHELRMLYDSNGTPRIVEGNDLGLSGAVSLEPAFMGEEPTSASVMDPSGGGVAAWTSGTPQGQPAVAVRESFPEGGAQTALVSGGAGGPVSELAVGRSGLGDGLIAFRQGPLGDAAIVATEASAAPARFVTSVPKGWIKPSQALISWLPAESADEPLSYSVVLDGRQLGQLGDAHEMRINAHGLGNGLHHVQVLATDRYGDSVLTPPSPLRIDGQPPVVSFRTTNGGDGVIVRVSDAQSGVAVNAVRVEFGDGHSAHGRTQLRHRYARPGIYTIVVHVRDKVGNAGVVSHLVSVR
jgi:PKD domain